MSEDKKRILVVDDEPDVLTFLSTLLEDNGYAVVTATNGEEALSQIEKSLPDLITLDITMPEKSGVKFYRQMKENDAWKAVPIIIVTGVSGEFQKFISTRRQVPPPEGYMQKPIEEKEILKLVAKLTS